MSSVGGYDPDESPPEWFENIDEDVERETDQGSPWRAIIAGIAVIAITLLVLIPALQARLLHERRESLPDREYDRVAVLFGAALLQRASTNHAMLFAVEQVRPDIESIVEVLSDSGGSRSGAGISVQAVPCAGLDEDADACYEARSVTSVLENPHGVLFGISSVEGEPKVTTVRLSGQTALMDRSS